MCSLRVVFCAILLLLFSQLARGQRFVDTTRILEQIGKGRNLLIANDWDSAAVVFNRALQQSQSGGYTEGVVIALGGAGHVLGAKGYPSQAIAKYLQGLEHCRQYSVSPLAILFIYGGLGEQYFELGQYDSSYFYFHEGLKQAEQHSQKDYTVIGLFYNNLTSYWVNMGKANKGLAFMEEVIRNLEQVKDSLHHARLSALLYMNKGNILYDHFGRRDSAIYYLKLSASVLANNPYHRALAFQNLGHIYLQDDDYSRALANLQKAYTIRKELSDLPGQAFIEKYLGYTYMKMKNYNLARFYLEKALQAYEGERKNSYYLEILFNLSEVYRLMHKPAEANVYLRRAYTYKDTLLSEQSAQHINELDARYRTAEKDKSIAQKEVEITRQRADIRQKNLLIGGVSVSVLFLTAFLIIAGKHYRGRKHAFSKQILLLKQEKELEKLKSLMKGEEQERQRIAREIHDGVGGMLAALKMHISIMQRKAAPALSEGQWNYLQEIVEETATEVRKTAHNLMPDLLLDHSFPEVLRLFAEGIAKSSGLQIDLQFHSNWKEPGKTFELSLYRILQEITQNTLKHAHASRLVLQFRIAEEGLHIMTEDNGCGFDTRKVKKGLGLHNIEARTKLLDGSILVESVAGKGTVYYLSFSYK